MKTRIFDRSRTLGTLHTRHRAGPHTHMCSGDQAGLTRCCMDPGTDTHISHHMGHSSHWSIHRMKGSDWSVQRPLIGRWWPGCHAPGYISAPQLLSPHTKWMFWLLSERAGTSIVSTPAMGGWSSKTRLSAEDMQFLQTKTQLDQASIEVDILWVLRHCECDLKVFCFRTGMRGSWWTVPPVSSAGISSVKCTPRWILFPDWSLPLLLIFSIS